MDKNVWHVCLDCGEKIWAPPSPQRECKMGCPMSYMCSTCKWCFPRAEILLRHSIACNVCPLCRRALLGFVDLVHHIFPNLFPERKNPPCWVIHGFNRSD